MSFNYGTDEEVKELAGFKRPDLGSHEAILKSLIHIGVYRETYLGEVKKPFPQVIAVYELKGDNDLEEDGVTPLVEYQTFPLKKGDKASCTKFIKTFDPKGTAEGFDEFIESACMVTMKAGKNDAEGNPYVNFGGVAGMTEKMAKALDLSLTVPGVGHVSFPDITKEAIMELNPILHVANMLMKSDDYPGSKAEEIINEIRKENPDFAKAKKKDDKEPEKQEGAKPEVASDLEADKEF